MSRVRMQVRIEQEMDVTGVLDGWTIHEVREFAADQDAEGRSILALEGEIEWQDREIDLRSAAVSAYLLDREERERLVAAPRTQLERKDQ